MCLKKCLHIVKIQRICMSNKLFSVELFRVNFKNMMGILYLLELVINVTGDKELQFFKNN